MTTSEPLVTNVRPGQRVAKSENAAAANQETAAHVYDTIYDTIP